MQLSKGTSMRMPIDADTACISFAHVMAVLLDLRGLRFMHKDFQVR